MLNSRFISIQLITSAFLLGSSCTTKNFNKMSLPKIRPELRCELEDTSTGVRHLVIAAKSHTTFEECIKNYSELDDEAQTDFQFCTTLKIKKNGDVSSVVINQSNLPRSLGWCIEQQLWSRNFSALQLNKSVYIRFPTNLQIKRNAKK